MSDTPTESSPAVDLSDLRLMPQWVADFGKQQPLRTFEDEETGDRPRRPGDRDRGRGGDRGGGGRPPFQRREGGGGGRPTGDRGPRPAGGGGRPPQGDRRREGGQGRGDFRRRDGDRGRDRDRDRGPRQEPPPQVVGLTVTIEPDHRAVEAMAHMIRGAGKAYSVFDAAKLVLSANDRFVVKFALAHEASAKLHTVPADGSLWLTRDEAVAHLLQSEVLQQFYKPETIELEEPKGNFTSVATCGFSGEILGPPNHHSYQTTLHKLHRERFSHIPFEDYKRRVRTDSTPEAVEKWKDSQKHGTQWIDLKAEVPEGGEAPRFKTRMEMEAHFRSHYASTLIGEATEATVAGNIPRRHLSPSLFNGMRHSVEESRKHLLPLAQRLCASFEHHGLKLFKRRGGKLWVSRNRPRLLDSHVAVSERIAKIVSIIKEKPGIPVKDLLHVLVPHIEAEKLAKAEALNEEAPAETVVEAPVDSSEASPEAAPETAAAATESDARVQALKDLHWLNSEGYIIEYSDGVVFPGVTEPPPAKPKPVRDKPQPAVKTEETSVASEAEAAPEEPVAEAESAAAGVEETLAEAETPADEATSAEVAAPVAEAAPEAPTEEASSAPAEHSRHQD